MRIKLTREELEKIFKATGLPNASGGGVSTFYFPEFIIVEGEEVREGCKYCNDSKPHSHYSSPCGKCGMFVCVCFKPSEIEGLWKKIDDIFWKHTIYLSKKDDLIDFDKILVDSHKIKEEIFELVKKLTKGEK